MYKQAKKDYAEYLAETAQRTARDERQGVLKKVSSKHGTEVREDDNVARSRLYAEMLMKRTGQLDPSFERR